MTEYIYIVKCDGCEDEMFNFFTDARMQCDLVMSKHPTISQIEIERNDFGECTDHCDLGTVWSWEEAMKDTETDAEPAVSIFTKDDLDSMNRTGVPCDKEFDDLDNSVDFEPETETAEVSNIDSVPDNFRKPIPEGMTLKELVEAMEENEDTVECAGCEELFPKADCTFNKEIGWVCGNCEDRVVKCTWCEELYDKSECRYEVDLGWLCSRCELAIKSRGETLTFREGNYWDFLDEEVEEPEVVHDLGNEYDGGYPETRTWMCYYNGNDLGTVEAATEEEAYSKMEKTWFWLNFNNEDVQVLPAEDDVENITEASLSDVLANANQELGTSYDEPGLLSSEGVEDEDFFADMETYPELQAERKRLGMEKAIKARTSKLEELEEAADYRKRLAQCPECGANESFDHETCFCLECGFNL